MDLSIVIIFCESDTDYLKNLLPTIPKDIEIIAIKTLQTDFELDADKSIKEIENVKYGTYYYKEFNFADARNYAKQYATGKWIFSLDADEYLSPRAFKLIRETISNIDKTVGGIICGLADVIPNETTAVIKVMRLFINKLDINWEFACHEQITDNIINAGYQIAETNILIEHLGYNISKQGLFNKLNRNFDLLCKEYIQQTHENKKMYIKNKLVETTIKLNQINGELNGIYS
jgi:glycosyltransferase involved in cell wall biosynthesis